MQRSSGTFPPPWPSPREYTDGGKKEIYVITGTDTDCGKTYCTLQLMRERQALGQSVIGIKPVSSGCIITPDGLRNDDAVQLQHASSIALPYDVINPFAFKEPASPHISAALAGIELTVADIIRRLQPALNTACDVIFIEGAGGLMVPINDHELMIDLIKALDVPVIFVTLMKLGCLNHTLLSFEALKSRQIPIQHWIPNSIDHNMAYFAENIAYLRLQLHSLTPA